jgi:(1->4)-alpha-D-glucan 1-alpha-D-glucosylmutase
MTPFSTITKTVRSIDLSPVQYALSPHGYDGLDPLKISESLGGHENLHSLAKAAHDKGMGIVYDIVPNHLSIDPMNPYMRDVFQNGSNSQYADMFAIYWGTEQKIHLPILGSSLKEAINSGGIRIVSEDGTYSVYLYDQKKYPVSEQSLKDVDVSKLLSGDPVAVSEFLGSQHYVFDYWRDTHLINYRTFFDYYGEYVAINTDSDVYRSLMESQVNDLIKIYHATGIRVDHVDGLSEPTKYIQGLRLLAIKALIEKDSAENENYDSNAIFALVEDLLANDLDGKFTERLQSCFPIFVEKVLSPDEQVVVPHVGTTGYELIPRVQRLFSESKVDAQWFDRYAGKKGANTLEQLVHDQMFDLKMELLETRFNGVVDSLFGQIIKYVPSQDEDVFTRAGHLFLASIDRYRTYVSFETKPNDDDMQAIQRAYNSACSRVASNHYDVKNALLVWRDVFNGNKNEIVQTYPEMRKALLELQSIQVAIEAMTLENILYYRPMCNPANQEVGCGRPAVNESIDPLKAFHDFCLQRSAETLSLNVTTTHDTKLGATARALLLALGETETRCLHGLFDDFYEKYVGSGSGVISKDHYSRIMTHLFAIFPRWKDTGEIRGLDDFVVKSINEAKEGSSWINPDQGYLNNAKLVVAQTVADLQVRQEMRHLYYEIQYRFQHILASTTVVHYSVPGIPDTYPNEPITQLQFFLVDPDNRHVSFPGEEVNFFELRGIQEGMISNMLRLRTDSEDLFNATSRYLPLAVNGDIDNKYGVLAYARLSEDGNHSTVVIVPTKLSNADCKDLLQGRVPDGISRISVELPESLRGDAPLLDVISDYFVPVSNGTVSFKDIYKGGYTVSTLVSVEKDVH